MNIFGSTGVRRRTSCHRRGRRGVRRWQAGVFGGAVGKVEFPASPARSVLFFTSREHIIALEPRGKGLLGITLRYPYEVRKEDEYFEDIPDEKIPKDMLELASHIVETKSGRFEPEKFEDQYEDALKELLKKKQAGGEDRST
jgi:non-homologous end joining protein Ku